MSLRASACATGVLLALALAACAPDSFRRKPEFEAWARDVRNECYFERIGVHAVGRLLGSSGARESITFLNDTSRLYAGRVTPEQWTSSVTAFLGGRPTDAGVRCVLDRLPPA